MSEEHAMGAVGEACPWTRVRRWRVWRWLWRDLLFLIVAVMALMWWQTRRLLATGAAPPDVVLTDLAGGVHRLSELRGKPVAVTFFAPWCSVCAAETGTISGLHRSAGNDGSVVAIALDYGGPGEVSAFAKAHGVDYPVLLGDDAVRSAFHVQAFPTTYFLDEQGRIKHESVGYTTWLGFRWRLWH
jgi:thiol-disulfide isomerase/thioredoxin